MKKYFFLILLISFNFLSSQVQDNVSWSVDPNPFNDSENIKISISGIDTSKWSTEDVYLWTWFYDSNDANPKSCDCNGDWDNSNESMKMTKNSDSTFSIEESNEDNNENQISLFISSPDSTNNEKSKLFISETLIIVSSIVIVLIGLVLLQLAPGKIKKPYDKRK